MISKLDFCKIPRFFLRHNDAVAETKCAEKKANAIHLFIQNRMRAYAISPYAIADKCSPRSLVHIMILVHPPILSSWFIPRSWSIRWVSLSNPHPIHPGSKTPITLSHCFPKPFNPINYLDILLFESQGYFHNNPSKINP